MTPFDLIILTLVVSSASIYANRRWEAYRFQRELSSAAALVGGDDLAEDDIEAEEGSPESESTGDDTGAGVSPADAKPKKKKRGWFGRRRRKDAADEVGIEADGTGEAVSPSADAKAKKKKRGWFGRRRHKDAADAAGIAADGTGEAVSSPADAKPKKKKRGWFGRRRRKDAADAAGIAADGTGEAESPSADAKAKKKKRGWFGRRRRKDAADAVTIEADGTGAGVSPVDAKAKKKKRGWFGRRRRKDAADAVTIEADGIGEIVAPTAQEAKAQDVGEVLTVPKKEADEGESEVVDHFVTGVAVMIALVMLVGVWIGWGIATVYGEASGEQSAGLNAALNVESTLTNGSVALYQDYRVFTEYARYQTLSDLEAGNGEEAAVSDLPARKNDDADLAAVQLPFFFTRYLTRDGYYDRPRQLGEAWAEAAQQVDLEPAPHFAVADLWQQKTELLIGLFIVLAFALLLLTLAGVMDRERKIMRYSSAILGALLLIFAIVAKFWIELG